MEIPTADALGLKQWNAGITVSELEEFDEPGVLANYGIFENTEVGLFWHNPDHGNSETLLNIKHQFRPGGNGRPSFAVGVADITDQLGTSVYAVGSWDIGRSIGAINGKSTKLARLHAGIGGGRLDDFFFGAEVRLSDRAMLMGEYVNSDFNVGARGRLWGDVIGQASLLNMEDVAVGVAWSTSFGGDDDMRPVIDPDRDEGRGEKPEEPWVPDAIVPKVGQTEPEPAVAETTEQPVPDPQDNVTEPTEPETTMERAEGAETAEGAPEGTTPTEGGDEPEDETTVGDMPTQADATTTEAGPTEADPTAETGEQLETVDEPKPAPEPEPAVDPLASPRELDGAKALVDIPSELGVQTDDGQVFVPLRSVAQWLGYGVRAELTKRGMMVTVFSGTFGATFLIGDDRVAIDGDTIELPAPTYYHEQRTAMVPVEFFHLFGIPTDADAEAGGAAFERHDVVGVLRSAEAK